MLFSSKLRTASTTKCALAWYRLAGSVSTCSAHQPARHSLDLDSHATMFTSAQFCHLNAMGVLVSPKRATQNDGGRGGLPYQRPSVRARKCPHSHLGRLLAVHPPREHILAQLHRLWHHELVADHAEGQVPAAHALMLVVVGHKGRHAQHVGHVPHVPAVVDR